jgi:SAM-dependent methyltransferase
MWSSNERGYTVKITEWLKLPQAKNIRNLDDVSTTLLHAKIIQDKPFLKKLYLDFYNTFKKSIPQNGGNKLLVELGSGGGFIKEIVPNAVTSDVLKLPGVDKHFSVLKMPFDNNSVDAYFMIDVLHHINDAAVFFKEMDRTLKAGGKIVMIEPANTAWGRFIYQNFHHERFDPLGGWGFEKTGPLSSANGAIPWIIFYRDRKQFERQFPSLKIVRLDPHTPLRYLISGGVSMRQMLPSFLYGAVKGLEIILSPFNKYIGMFLTIEINKIS